jgi:hypothetical protein
MAEGVASCLTHVTGGAGLVILGFVALRVVKDLLAIIISLRGSKPSERPKILLALSAVLRPRRSVTRSTAEDRGTSENTDADDGQG